MLRWVLKKYLYYTGIRFYESSHQPSSPEGIRNSFKGTSVAHGDTTMDFEFYREVFTDLLYKGGKFTPDSKHIFLMKVSIGEGADTQLVTFKGARFICHNDKFPYIPDDIVADALQGLYISYLNEKNKRTI